MVPGLLKERPFSSNFFGFQSGIASGSGETGHFPEGEGLGTLPILTHCSESSTEGTTVGELLSSSFGRKR